MWAPGSWAGMGVGGAAGLAHALYLVVSEEDTFTVATTKSSNTGKIQDADWSTLEEVDQATEYVYELFFRSAEPGIFVFLDSDELVVITEESQEFTREVLSETC